MWTQEHEGTPGFFEFSVEPGSVTAVDVMARDDDGNPIKYRLVKKALGPLEDKREWHEMLLCNPCGIWLGKFKGHRPSDRWEKDKARLNGQPRKKRESKGPSNSRARKSRTKSDGQVQPTSEAYFATDPVGPGDYASPQDEENMALLEVAAAEQEQSQSFRSGSNPEPALREPKDRQGFESTHSRGSGTANSPIAVDDDCMGTTRRLLFPSPRKDGLPNVLGPVSANVMTAPQRPTTKQGKENDGPVAPTPTKAEADEMRDLFGTPPPRPSTPPPKSAAPQGPFKTPTRQTPSHRPITRSVSKSIRSVRSIPPFSPGQALMMLQRTPTRSSSGGKSKVNRTPGRQNLHAHFNSDLQQPFDSPFTANINKLLSEANEFTVGSPAHGLLDLQMNSNLPNMFTNGDGDFGSAAMNFSNFLSTDMAMPSSPPIHMRSEEGLDFDADPALWASFSEALAAEEAQM